MNQYIVVQVFQHSRHLHAVWTRILVSLDLILCRICKWMKHSGITWIQYYLQDIC